MITLVYSICFLPVVSVFLYNKLLVDITLILEMRNQHPERFGYSGLMSGTWGARAGFQVLLESRLVLITTHLSPGTPFLCSDHKAGDGSIPDRSSEADSSAPGKIKFLWAEGAEK